MWFFNTYLRNDWERCCIYSKDCKIRSGWAVGIGGVPGDCLDMYVYIPSVCVHVQNIISLVFFKCKQQTVTQGVGKEGTQPPLTFARPEADLSP